jgi:RNA 3'-terminal phosphate cyclase (ATP)
MVTIDGSYGEGGGQMIRTALTLSAITQKPLEIINIRAKRPNPGLAMQHVTCARAVRNICRGRLEGAERGSQNLIFEPGPIVGGKYEFDIGTAGASTLVAQTIIPILLKAAKASEIGIIGGTHVMKSPGFDYFEKVFLPAVERFGVKIGCRMLKPGYYPRGGGRLEFSLAQAELKGCTDWLSGDESIQAIIRLSGLDESIAMREKKIFVQNGIERVYLRRDESLSVGNAITAWKGFRGAYVLGELGKRAETVAQEALDGVLCESGDVDLHLADQLLLYAALSEGQTKYRTSSISEHFKTNAHVISQFLERKIEIDGNGISVS